MPLALTHVAYTEQWECDVNNHLNVKFYFKRFDEALATWGLLTGTRPTLTVRHVRFHKELFADSGTHIHSGVLASGPHTGALVHILANAETGAVAATALDTLAEPPEGFVASEEDAAPAIPRGVAPGPTPAVDAEALVEAGGASVTNIAVADPMRFAAGGAWRPHEFIAGFSDAGSHVWAHAGLSTEYLKANNFGRVAVEMKLTVHAPVTPGTILRQISWVPDVAQKSFALSHQVSDMASGTVLARGEARALIIDLGARRVAPVPPTLRAYAGTELPAHLAGL